MQTTTTALAALAADEKVREEFERKS